MTNKNIRFDWIDALKAFAIFGILLNHAVETFHSYPWFSNPSANWPPLTERLNSIFPKDGSFVERIIQFLGWLGDMGPGIFILLSGLTLTISALNKPKSKIDFYKTRATRIYPLYITIHLIILFFAVTFFKWGNNYMLLMSPISMLGLRFTNALFGFLNPSWWFIWLILQMYLIFPFLIIYLKKSGPVLFLGVTFLITVLARLLGILGLTLSADMYSWMTGLFGGTRLFEFTFGMFIGYLLYHKNQQLQKILNARFQLLIISLLIYCIGFVASWTYMGSLISNVLITIGLSGIFYSLYELTIKRSKKIETSLLWIGRNSFSVFLLHQPFMKYFGDHLSSYDRGLALAIIAVISFFFGHWIEIFVNKLFPLIQTKYNSVLNIFRLKFGLSLAIAMITGTTLMSILILTGKMSISKYVYLIFVIQSAYLILYRFVVRPEHYRNTFKFLDSAILISASILLLGWNWMALFWIFILFVSGLLILLKNTKEWNSVFISIGILVAIIFSVETILKNVRPIEVNYWGELPALQTDSETTYSLIPNKLTHLKYNNYDYYVKTNSLGFTSPEIDLASKAVNEIRILTIGDAFTMPEGLDYNYSYSALLEKKLREKFPQKDIHVIDAGVTGYGPNEEEAQLKKIIKTVKPDIVLNQLFINEFSDINNSRNDILKGIGLTKENFYRRRLFSNALVPAEFLSFANRMLKTKSRDGYKYNKSLLYLYEKKSDLYSDTSLSKMNSFLSKMKEICKINNAEYVVLGVPGQIEVSPPGCISYYPYSINLNDTSRFDFDLPLRTFGKLCKKNNIEYLDTQNYLKKQINQPVYFRSSWHWNKKGHIAVAKFLFDHLKNMNIFD